MVIRSPWRNGAGPPRALWRGRRLVPGSQAGRRRGGVARGSPRPGRRRARGPSGGRTRRLGRTVRPGARVEHADVRRSVGPGAGGPLPTVVVGGEVAVVEVLEEEPRPTRPVEMEILDEKTGNDHPHTVVDEALFDELAHAGVDDRKAGATVAPRGESLVGVAATVDPDAGEGFVERLPGRLRPGAQDVCVEVTPGQLLGEHLVARFRGRGGSAVVAGAGSRT